MECGEGFVTAIAKMQARIDRLENLIEVVFANVCKDTKSVFFDEDDDVYADLCWAIICKAEELKGERDGDGKD